MADHAVPLDLGAFEDSGVVAFFLAAATAHNARHTRLCIERSRTRAKLVRSVARKRRKTDASHKLDAALCVLARGDETEVVRLSSSSITTHELAAWIAAQLSQSPNDLRTSSWGANYDQTSNTVVGNRDTQSRKTICEALQTATTALNLIRSSIQE